MAKNRATSLTHEENGEPSRINTREQLASHRKRLVLGRLFRAMDGAILPVMRLGLLLSCWLSSSSSLGHGGNLSLWWSGLSYEATPTATAFATATGSSSSSSSPVALHSFFVLYAHRRWLNRIALSLANTSAESLQSSYRESTDLLRRQVGALREEGRRWQRRLRPLLRQRLRQRLRWWPGARKTTTVSKESSRRCRICGASDPTIPYRFSCGRDTCDGNDDGNDNDFVACYTCLWEAVASTAAKRNTKTVVRCPICYQETSQGSATPI